jgi:arylsulfatase A-like enzyme/Tfp pilus assembly protein PilF
MKKHLKPIIVGIILAGLLVVVLLVNPFKKKSVLPVLKTGIDYNLLVITMDTTRADSLGCYGHAKAVTPNIDALAKEGVLFKNCYASVPITLPSHCSLFTGKLPIAHGVRNNGTYVLDKKEHTLAEYFNEKGYDTSAVIASFVLESKFGLNQGFNTYDDSLDYQTVFKNAKNEIPADLVYAKFNYWFNKNHHKKFFSWVHFYDPHYPYNPPGRFKEVFKEKPYIGEIAYVDHYIGKIIQDLKAKKILEKTIVIITGDHGEAFGEHKEFGHTIFCYEENLKSPLIFYNPGVFNGGKHIQRRVKLVDVMPSLLQLFGWEIPPAVQGESLLTLFNEKETDNSGSLVYFESMQGKEFMNWAPLTGIIFENYKYVSLPHPELYDLEKDPLERNNIYLQKKNHLAKTLDKKLREYMLQQAGSGEAKRRKLSAADKKKLESLGYISTSAGQGGKAADPKDGIVSFNEITKANRLVKTGQPDEAEQVFKRIMAEQPELKMTQLYDGLYALYRVKKDPVQLEKYLKKASTDFPGLNYYNVLLARFYSRSGNLEKAERLCKEILEQDAINTHAHVILGQLYYKKGIAEQAIASFQEAMKLEPLNEQIRMEYAELLLAAGRIRDVKETIEKILGNDVLMNAPESIDIKTRIGVVLLQMKEYDRVIALCNTILSSSKKSPQVYNQLGTAYFKKGDFQESLKAYKTALELDPKNALTLSLMGNFYLTLFQAKKDKDYHKWAVDYYSRAIDADPGMDMALNGLAVAYSYAGDQGKAVLFWGKALKVNPDFTDIYFHLGITYLEMGQKKNALKYLEQCKNRLYKRLSSQEQIQLDRLIMEAL